tara:strand:- start:807 stop:1202 length:396 start_codon:yes stop_codon:yes gene_type:complete
MNKIKIILKPIFYISIIFLLVISLFPGSLIGYLLYNDIGKQPSMIDNTFGPTLNHLIYYFYVSILGLFAYFGDKFYNKIVFFLFFISIFLELVHYLIPNRAFEPLDLIANFFGVLIAYFAINIYNIKRRKQ